MLKDDFFSKRDVVHQGSRPSSVVNKCINYNTQCTSKANISTVKKKKRTILNLKESNRQCPNKCTPWLHQEQYFPFLKAINCHLSLTIFFMLMKSNNESNFTLQVVICCLVPQDLIEWYISIKTCISSSNTDGKKQQ